MTHIVARKLSNIMILMRSKRHSSRTLHTVLLVAFVHHWNACPCGCLDGNRWFSLAQSLVTTSPLSLPADSKADGPEQLDDEHCDGEVHTFFLTAQRGSHLLPNTLCCCPGHVHPQPATDDVTSVAIAPPTSSALGQTAQEIRAQIQVFLV